MARNRQFTAIALIACLLSSAAHGCGPMYEAPPPTLDYYLQKLPAKSFGDIVGKTASSNAAPLDMKAVVDDLNAKFDQGDPLKRVAEVDDYLTKARASGSTDTDLNFLECLRDAAASNKMGNFELKEYAKWRWDNDSWFVTGNANVYNMKALNDKMSLASPGLKPCWLYLMGALNFRAGDMDKSEGFFDQILSDYKDAPCAEMALFMKARCWHTRASSDQAKKGDGDAARKWFQEYIARYPKGRFVADAWGWLGGLESDEALALVDFAKQAECTDHPEVFASAENEVARIFENLDYSEGSQGFDEVAQHPELALAVTYVVVNTVTTPLPADDFYQPPSAEDQARLEKWRATALPKLAAAVLAHKDLYQGASDQDRYLTILAHAASDHGDQQKARELIAMVPKDHQPSDDFLFVKALVLQRSGQLEAAIKSYRELLSLFPQSTLVPGSQYRLALALHDLKREGDALLELSNLTDHKLPIYYPANDQGIVLAAPSPTLYRPIGNGDYYGVKDYTGAQTSQIKQTFETILNFGEIESLASPLKDNDPDHALFRQQLREVLVERCLARDDFGAAATFTDDPALKEEYTEQARKAVPLMAVKLNAPRNAAPIQLPRAELAAAAMDLGDYWTARRFKLTWIPLQAQVSDQDFKKEDSDEFRRLHNGMILHYPEPEINQTLDSLDELSHAVSWWRKVDAFDPQGSLAPQALWKIIQGRRLIAEETPYALQRAADTHMANEVRQEYDRLRQLYPDSIEAKQYAAYWSIPLATELEAAYSYDELWNKYPGYNSKLTHYGHAHWFVALKIPFEDDESAEKDLWEKLCEGIYDFPDTSKAYDQTAYAQKIADLRKRAGPLALTLNRASVINCLDDLVDLSAVASLDPVVRTEYLKARINFLVDQQSHQYGYSETLRNKQPYLLTLELDKDPRCQPISDFVDGLAMAKTADDFDKLPNLADAFLQKYPKSPKRELAAFYRIRAALHKPGVDPNDATTSAALDTAFSDYEKEFPQGKLERGVLWMHGQAEMSRKHFGLAAHYFALILEQDEAPELKQDAAFAIATVFDQLNDDSLRHGLLQEILKDTAAREFLRKYSACGELPFLKDYVVDQLASK